ncbi:caspase-7-like isoform X2 [Branchiostoma floridae]|uniref:Caspase-7-like isoform X2 n=1 Tax=Branchiostoma floridae TaxID=7739 RepID=A0A9J7KU49_BRAFL|nr:caspase-7-like isoform X2 [Branchiostoma floridae]
MGDRRTGEDVTDANPSGPEVADITGAQVRRTLEKLSVQETTQEKTPATRSPEPSGVGNMASAPTIDVHSQSGSAKVQEPPNTPETAPGSKMASVHGEENLESQPGLQSGAGDLEKPHIPAEGKPPPPTPTRHLDLSHTGEKLQAPAEDKPAPPTPARHQDLSHTGEKLQAPAEGQPAPSTPARHLDLSHMYDMTHRRRGMAIVINNKEFQKKTKQKTRKGTDQDADGLFKQLTNLDFDVDMNDNLTCKQMEDVLKKAAAADHSDADCVLVALLSHGEEKMIYGTDGMVEIADLAAHFNGVNCKSLVGKPKIFIIQACQGSKVMEGVDMPDAVGFRDDDLVIDAPPPQTLPSEADFLYYYSTMPGYYAWRNQEAGSWSIQSLCAVLKEHGKSGLEVMQILTRVNRTVATQFESRTREEKMNRKKQIPCIMSMLTKELYFTPKNLAGRPSSLV